MCWRAVTDYPLAAKPASVLGGGAGGSETRPPARAASTGIAIFPA